MLKVNDVVYHKIGKTPCRVYKIDERYIDVISEKKIDGDNHFTLNLNDLGRYFFLDVGHTTLSREVLCNYPGYEYLKKTIDREIYYNNNEMLSQGRAQHTVKNPKTFNLLNRRVYSIKTFMKYFPVSYGVGATRDFLRFKDGDICLAQLDKDVYSSIREYIEKVIDREKNLVICVMPSSKQFQYGKGISELAKELCNELSIVYEERILTRIESVQPAHLGGDRSGRVHYDSISVMNGLSSDTAIMILDDITTTGSSLRSAANLLNSIYPTLRVYLAAVAETVH